MIWEKNIDNIDIVNYCDKCQIFISYKFKGRRLSSGQNLFTCLASVGHFANLRYSIQNIYNNIFFFLQQTSKLKMIFSILSLKYLNREINFFFPACFKAAVVRSRSTVRSLSLS